MSTPPGSFSRRREVVSGNRDHGHAYLGIRPHGNFQELLGGVPVAHEHYTFIDYGSGKGRALLLAAEWPFKAIIGVEFSRELHRIAEDNLRTYQNPGYRCRDIRTLCMDAVEFELPHEPAILYFYNPFSEAVSRAALSSRRSGSRSRCLHAPSGWATRSSGRIDSSTELPSSSGSLRRQTTASTDPAIADAFSVTVSLSLPATLRFAAL